MSEAMMSGLINTNSNTDTFMLKPAHITTPTTATATNKNKQYLTHLTGHSLLGLSNSAASMACHGRRLADLPFAPGRSEGKLNGADYRGIPK